MEQVKSQQGIVFGLAMPAVFKDRPGISLHEVQKRGLKQFSNTEYVCLNSDCLILFIGRYGTPCCYCMLQVGENPALQLQKIVFGGMQRNTKDDYTEFSFHRKTY